jgi:hypothetical protein
MAQSAADVSATNASTGCKYGQNQCERRHHDQRGKTGTSSLDAEHLLVVR